MVEWRGVPWECKNMAKSSKTHAMCMPGKRWVWRGLEWFGSFFPGRNAKYYPLCNDIGQKNALMGFRGHPWPCRNEQKCPKTYKKLQPVQGGWGGDSNCVSYIFMVKTQESIPRALLQAIKMHWWGSGVTHGHAEMGENDQKSVNGYVLFRVGGKQIQCVPVVFFLVNTQYSFPRVMFQARKMCRRGTGDTHGHARMGKNDDSLKRATFCWRWVERGF